MMVKFLLGFVSGIFLILILVYFKLITPRTIKTVSKDPEKGLSQAADNVIKNVKEGVSKIRTNEEAAKIVYRKTSKAAICRREGLSLRHVCTTVDKRIYRVINDKAILYKGDLELLGEDVVVWLRDVLERAVIRAEDFISDSPKK